MPTKPAPAAKSAPAKTAPSAAAPPETSPATGEEPSLLTEEASPDTEASSGAGGESGGTPEAKTPGTPGKEETKDAGKDRGSPEAGDVGLELDLPKDFTANPDLLGKLKAHAKEWGLKKEQAQAILELGVAAQKGLEQELREHHEQQVKEWRDASKKDKEIGGARFDENKAVAHKAMKAFATPDLLKLLDTSGLGNHPELLRLFHRIGTRISEDSSAGTKGTGSAGPAAGSKEAFFAKMYPKSKQVQQRGK